MATSSAAVADELHGHGLVALGRGRGDEVGRPHVDVHDGEVEVVQAVALGDGAGQRVLAQRAGLDEDVLGRAAAGPGGLDRLLDALARREPELDDDVGQEARPARAGARRRDPVPPVGRRPVNGQRLAGSRRRRHRAQMGMVGVHVGLEKFLMRGGLSHDLHGSGPAGPALEAQRTLLDEDLEAVDHLRSTAPRLLRQHGAAGPVDQVDHARVFTDGIGLQRQIP